MLNSPDPALVPQAVDAARAALEIEAAAVARAWDNNREALDQALQLLASSRGRIVVSGLGKSGHIGAKMAATLCSFGAPTAFMNSSEALHGDFGVCEPDDVGIVISYSGRTAEVVAVTQWMKNFGMPVIAMTKAADSPVSSLADVHLSIAVEREADPLNLGPTASTAVTLALGDALGAGLQVLRQFTAEDFRLRHPGGSLGADLAAVGKEAQS